MPEMPKLNLRPTVVALSLCALCALFPPRYEAGRDTKRPASRGFLPTSGAYRQVTRSERSYTSYNRVDIDYGRLALECFFFLSLSGAITLHQWQQSEKNQTPATSSEVTGADNKD